MTRDPYRIAGPAVISFSGGRTSGFMLKHILDAHGGTLSDDVRVVFANTGKERPETLDFVAECGARWGIHITWVEYDWDEPHRKRIVSYDSAARDGEPFEALIDRKGFVPNPRMRFCTSFLKRDRPDLAAWWIAQEAKPGKSSAKGHCADMRVFRIDREPYAALIDQVERQGVLALPDPAAPEIDWEREDCVCTD